MTTLPDTPLLDTTRDTFMAGLDAMGDTAEDLLRTTAEVAGDVIDAAVSSAPSLPLAPTGRGRWRRRLFAAALVALIVAVIATVVAKARAGSADEATTPSDGTKAGAMRTAV